MSRAAFVLVACALTLGCVSANAPRACRFPSAGDNASLGIHQFNDFGKDYEVFELMVEIDGCIYFHSEDTRILQQEEFRIPAQALPAGQHHVLLEAQLRSGFSADMHNYHWWGRNSTTINLEPNAAQNLVVRMSEVMHRDPRHRLQVSMYLEPATP